MQYYPLKVQMSMILRSRDEQQPFCVLLLLQLLGKKKDNIP
jgi:hypothetical protein